MNVDTTLMTSSQGSQSALTDVPDQVNYRSANCQLTIEQFLIASLLTNEGSVSANEFSESVFDLFFEKQFSGSGPLEAFSR